MAVGVCGRDSSCGGGSGNRERQTFKIPPTVTSASQALPSKGSVALKMSHKLGLDAQALALGR